MHPEIPGRFARSHILAITSYFELGFESVGVCSTWHSTLTLSLVWNRDMPTQFERTIILINFKPALLLGMRCRLFCHCTFIGHRPLKILWEIPGRNGKLYRSWTQSLTGDKDLLYRLSARLFRQIWWVPLFHHLTLPITGFSGWPVFEISSTILVFISCCSNLRKEDRTFCFTRTCDYVMHWTVRIGYFVSPVVFFLVWRYWLLAFNFVNDSLGVRKLWWFPVLCLL
jgi:hypothetical protein